MTKQLFWALFALVFITACSPKKEAEAAKDAETSTIDSLRRALDQTKNESNDNMTTIGQVLEGFRQINEAEGRVSTETMRGESSNREKIAENMAFIQRTLKLNRELIANLQEQLRSSKLKDSKTKASLETVIATLQQRMKEQDQSIAALQAELNEKNIRIAAQTEQISSLNTNVSDLNAKNEEKAAKLEAQDKAMNTVYYVFGTKKELREQKILESGDVLRSGNFNKDYFTGIDLRVTKTIKLYSKRAELKTNHPAGSYSLDKDSQGQYTLRIINPQTFWSISKYLVIIVK